VAGRVSLSMHQPRPRGRTAPARTLEVRDRRAIESANFVALDIRRPDELPVADNGEDEFRS